MGKNSKKTVIIGLDGVPYGLLKGLAEGSVMPHTGKIISKGIFRKMRSSLPEVSSVAWSSMITGANPAEHGIFGFTDLFPRSYNLKFPNFTDLKKPPFWAGRKEKSVVINVPATYPVKEMNGAHISGFVSLDLERSVWPKSLIPELRELDYRLDVDSELAHKSMDLFLEDLEKTLKSRIKAFRLLWNYIDWDFFMLVFTATDRLMHFLWEAWEDKNHKYHNVFLRHFRAIDEAIGEIGSQMHDNDLLIILSDHGFERLNKDVYINHFLAKKGFLSFAQDQKPCLANIGYATKAFALDPARIYLNLKDKYPSGSVNEREKEEILQELEDLFSNLIIDHQKVIRQVYRKKDVYQGQFLDEAPDLILEANTGFNLKANINSDKLSAASIFTGKHTLDNAFFLANNAKVNIAENLSICGLRGIIENDR